MRTCLPLGPALLAASFLAAPAAAQTAPDNGTVGPSEIRDFSLPGSRPAPPAEPEPTIAPVQIPRAEPPREIAPTPTPAPAEPTPSPGTTPPPPTRQPAAAQRAPASIATPAPISEARPNLPTPADVTEALPAPVIETPATEPVLPAPLPAPEAAMPAPAAPIEESGGSSWLWLALAGLAGALGLIVWRSRRTRAAAAPQPDLLRVAPTPPAPKPQPTAPVRAAPPAPAIPAPAPQPVGGVGITMRPWLEIEFRPERAVATEAGAEVRYEVTIRNTGNAPARNVRLAARMFSAGPELDREIAGFFGLGIDDSGAAPLTILPRSEVTFQSLVALPRAEVKEIRMDGRSLFVPTVAFNLLYAWGRDRSGQTCSSHVVGREAEVPTAKMGPFRLDLGPRIWRSVGQRPSNLARAV